MGGSELIGPCLVAPTLRLIGITSRQTVDCEGMYGHLPSCEENSQLLSPASPYATESRTLPLHLKVCITNPTYDSTQKLGQNYSSSLNRRDVSAHVLVEQCDVEGKTFYPHRSIEVRRC